MIKNYNYLRFYICNINIDAVDQARCFHCRDTVSVVWNSLTSVIGYRKQTHRKVTNPALKNTTYLGVKSRQKCVPNDKSNIVNKSWNCWLSKVVVDGSSRNEKWIDASVRVLQEDAEFALHFIFLLQVWRTHLREKRILLR